MYRCRICLEETDFICVCDYAFCAKCAEEEYHDRSTQQCQHCQINICKSFMGNFREKPNLCFSCGCLEELDKIKIYLGNLGKMETSLGS